MLKMKKLILFVILLLSISNIYAETSDAVDLKLGGWDTIAYGVSVNADGSVYIKKIHIQMPNRLGGGLFIIPDVQVDSKGSITGCGEGTAAARFRGTNLFSSLNTRYIITDDKITASGNVFLNEKFANEDGVFISKIYIYPNGQLKTEEETSAEIEYMLSDFPVSGRGLKVDEYGIHLSENTITLFSKDNEYASLFPHIPIKVGGLHFYADGRLRAGGMTSVNETFLPDGNTGFGLNINYFWIDEYHDFKMNAAIVMPTDFFAAEIQFNELTINSDNTVVSETMISRATSENDGVSVSLENLRFNKDRFKIGEGTFALSNMDNASNIQVRNFYIDKNGSFNLEKVYGAYAKIGSYSVGISSIRFKDMVFEIEGNLTLPQDLPISRLAGKRIELEKLAIDAEKGDVALTTVLPDSYSFYLNNQLYTEFTGIAFTSKGFFIKDVIVNVPREFEINDLEFLELFYDYNKKDFDWQNAASYTAENIQLIQDLFLNME